MPHLLYFLFTCRNDKYCERTGPSIPLDNYFSVVLDLIGYSVGWGGLTSFFFGSIVSNGNAENPDDPWGVLNCSNNSEILFWFCASRIFILFSRLFLSAIFTFTGDFSKLGRLPDMLSGFRDSTKLDLYGTSLCLCRKSIAKLYKLKYVRNTI